MLVMLLGAGVLSFGAVAPASAQSPDPAPGGRHMRHDGGHRPGGMMGMGDPFMMAVQQLSPTEDQKTRIKSLMESARQQQRGQFAGDGSLLLALGNPGDPGYPAAVQDAKKKAADMIQARSELDVQVYAMLTDEQKAKLPQVLADMKSKVAQWREGWHQK
jgi:Spy/CpxP family protein refolding chaperone